MIGPYSIYSIVTFVAHFRDRAWYRYRLQSLVPVLVPGPVPGFTGDSGTGSGAKFSSGRVLI